MLVICLYGKIKQTSNHPFLFIIYDNISHIFTHSSKILYA